MQKIDKQELFLKTQSSPVASELRLRQVEIIDTMNRSLKVELLGLPHKVVTEVKEIDKAAKEIVFKVKTDKASPAGAHKNVFCRVTLTDQNEPIIHSRLGVTELQRRRRHGRPDGGQRRKRPHPVSCDTR